MENSTTALDLPVKVQAIVNSWSAFKAATDEYVQKVAEMRAAERVARRITKEDDYLLIVGSHDVQVKMDEVVERVLGSLIRVAVSEFSPSGARLDISNRDLSALPAACEETFDPVAVWTHLVDSYGGQAGEEKAFGGKARELGNSLRISVGCEPRIVGGRSIFSESIWPDRTFGGVLSYTDMERLDSVFDGFLAAGKWSGHWDYLHVAGVQAAKNITLEAYRSKRMPERFSIGEDVLIVPFKSKWEFRISPAFAEKVQLFLTEFNGFYTRGY